MGSRRSSGAPFPEKLKKRRHLFFGFLVDSNSFNADSGEISAEFGIPLLDQPEGGEIS